MTYELQAWALVVSVLLPMVVGFTTKASWPSAARAVLLLALATITSLVEQIIAAGGINGVAGIGDVLVGALVSFVIAVAMHFGIYKSTGISDTLIRRTGVKDDYRLAG